MWFVVQCPHHVQKFLPPFESPSPWGISIHFAMNKKMCGISICHYDLNVHIMFFLPATFWVPPPLGTSCSICHLLSPPPPGEFQSTFLYTTDRLTTNQILLNVSYTCLAFTVPNKLLSCIACLEMPSFFASVLWSFADDAKCYRECEIIEFP